MINPNLLLLVAVWLIHLLLWYFTFRKSFESPGQWPWIVAVIFVGVIAGAWLNDLVAQEQISGFIKLLMFLPYPAIIFWLYSSRQAKSS